jgi:hypothetical protein
MIKKIFLMICATLFLLEMISAIAVSSDSIYLEKNVTYPLVLTPLDSNIWNISLWIYDGNWSSLNFTWNGSQYELSILFNNVGDFPFVINSTEVSGEITGTFLVREVYNVTFRFYKEKSSTLFSSNRYVNEMSYVTAELTGVKTLFNNNYDTNLEPFVARISDARFQKPVWHSKYSGGEAVLRLYETGNYAVRLIDGEITFDGEYAVPNITKSYGVNVYVGKYNFNQTASYDIYLSSKDLNPYGWLFNISFVILVLSFIVISIFLFFIIPDKPFVSFVFGVGGIIMLIVARVVIWFFIG